MTMNTRLLIVLFIVISVLMYHVLHELMHVIAGRMAGLELESIKWFSYHGGTKVTFKGEEKVLAECEKSVPKAWVIMSLAGIVGTTMTGYISVGVFYLLPVGYAKLFMWVLSAIFLLNDAGYSVLCAFADSGDLYLVNRYFRKTGALKLISVMLLTINILIFISTI